jgi:hypothetical protein
MDELKQLASSFNSSMTPTGSNFGEYYRMLKEQC